MAKAVVLGGGFAGLEAIFYLRHRLGDRIALTLVSDQEHFLFKPNTIYIPFGEDPETLKIPLDKPTRRKHIEFVHGRVTALEPDPNKGAEIYRASCMVCHGQEGRGGVPNPGSTDQSIPPLNPIDPTLASADPRQFAINFDLFIRHGCKPEGARPAIQMPAWGDLKRLTPQQIADVIAYVIRLNRP